MVLSHIWGLYTHPKTEWDRIDHDKESFFSSLLHVILLAFIPALSAYYSAVYIGWQIANGPVTTLSSQRFGACRGYVSRLDSRSLCTSSLNQMDGSYFWRNAEFHSRNGVGRLHLNTAVYGGFCRALSRALGNDSRRPRGPLLCGVSALYRRPHYDAHP